MKTNIHSLSRLAQFVFKRETFQTKVVQKIETHILCSTTFFEIREVYEIIKKVKQPRYRPGVAQRVPGS